MTDFGMTQFQCPSCSAAQSELRAGTTFRPASIAQKYFSYRCLRCDLIFWTPLEMNRSVYEGELFEAYEDYHAARREFPAWAEKLSDLQAVPPGKSLDIGCADGAVVDRLASVGFDAWGIDLDGLSLRMAREVRGLRQLFHGTLEEFVSQHPALLRSFDVITFFEVLEHQTDPRLFLDSVRRLARPGAVIAGSVPNRNRFLVGLDRTLSAGDHPPHHFLWFSRTALENMLEGAGFGEVSVSYARNAGVRSRIRSARRIVDRRLQKFRPGWWIAPLRIISSLLLPLIGGALVAGESLRPSHLYFSCQIREPR